MGNIPSCCPCISSPNVEGNAHKNVISSPINVKENAIPSSKVEENVIPSSNVAEIEIGTSSALGNDVELPPLPDLEHLDEIIYFIETRLRAIDNSEEAATSSISNKEAASTSTYGFVLLEKVLNRVKKQASKILKGETRKALIDLLKGISNAHWVVAGLGVLAYVLDQIDKISANKKECVQFLLYMCGLAKQIKQLQSHIDEKKLTDVVSFIVDGSLFCISRMQATKLSKFFSASMDSEELKSLQYQLGITYPDLNLDVGIQILNRIPTTLPPNQGRDPNAVGIEDARARVSKLLDLENKSIVRAVVLYGVGGIGKTTLAASVFSSLKLDTHNYCRIDIQQNSQESALKQLQKQVISDLFSQNIELRNCDEGKQYLHKLFKEAASQQEHVDKSQPKHLDKFKEVTSKPVFLFIDNVLKGSDLTKLLPKNLCCLPKGSRLLITTRNLDDIQMIQEKCITCHELSVEKFELNCLSYTASKQLLCLKVLGDANEDFEENMNIDGILKLCGGVPFILEMVGIIFKKHGNNVTACQGIIDFLNATLMKGSEGDCSETLVDEVYKTLKDDIYRDAFLDIATFFSNWDQEKVRCIVGDVPLKALQDAALVRISENDKVILHDIIQARRRKLLEDDRINDYQSFQCAFQPTDSQKLAKLKGIWLPDHHADDDDDTSASDTNSLRPRDLKFMKRSLKVLYIGGGYRWDGENNESFIHQGSLHNSFGQLESLCFLQFHNCPELKRLPTSFGNLSALKMLNLSGSMLESLPNSFDRLSRLEELDLSCCKHLESLPSSFGQLSRLKKLNMCRCKQLSRLPDGFGKLNSLTQVSLRGCKELNMLSGDFQQLTLLCAVDASFCYRLHGEAMNTLVQMNSLIFLNIEDSPMFIKRWREEKVARPVLIRTNSFYLSYLDFLHIALFHKDTKFLENDGRDVYFADWSAGRGGKEVGFVVSTCDLSSLSSKASLDMVKQKVAEVSSEGVEMVYIGLGQSVEVIRQALLLLPRGTRALVSPDEKTNKLLGYCLYRLGDNYKSKYHNILIARARLWREKYVSDFELLSADVEEFRDIAGGFRRFFFPLPQTEKFVD